MTAPRRTPLFPDGSCILDRNDILNREQLGDLPAPGLQRPDLLAMNGEGADQAFPGEHRDRRERSGIPIAYFDP